MAWVAEELFDSLSDGDLNTQGGGSGWSAAWTGDTDYDVQGTDTFLGSTKAVTSTNANGNISRTLTSATTSGTVWVAMKSTANTGDAQTDFMVGVAASIRASLRDNGSGGIKASIFGSGSADVLNPISTTTWYVWKIDYNGTTFDAYLYDDTGLLKGSALAQGYGTNGDISSVRFNSGSSQTVLWDYISPTNPFSAGGGGRNTNLLLLGVGQ